MSISKRYSPEVQERAIGLVFKQQGEHVSHWAAIASISIKISCAAETFRKWVRHVEPDHGKRSDLSSSSVTGSSTLRAGEL